MKETEAPWTHIWHVCECLVSRFIEIVLVLPNSVKTVLGIATSRQFPHHIKCLPVQLWRRTYQSTRAVRAVHVAYFVVSRYFLLRKRGEHPADHSLDVDLKSMDVANPYRPWTCITDVLGIARKILCKKCHVITFLSNRNCSGKSDDTYTSNQDVHGMQMSSTIPAPIMTT